MAEKGFLSNLKSWKVVFLSLVGATTFWFFNELNKEHTTRLIYPLEFNFERDSVVIMEPLPEVIKVDVTSGGWNLVRRTFILFNPVPIIIDLDNPTLIRYYTRATLLPVVTEQLSELKINYLLTDTIFFNIEEKRNRRVKVSVDSLSLQLRGDYRVTSAIEVSPDTVEIIGPKSIIDGLIEPYMVQINESRIDDDFEDEVEIPLQRRDVTLSIPEEVQVTFNVERFERISVPVTFDALNFPEDSSAYPEYPVFNVFFTVKRSEKQEYEDFDFGITVDYNLFESQDSTVTPIMIYSPEEVFEIDMEPESMKVIFSKN